MRRSSLSAAAAGRALGDLTERELEVLVLLTRELSNAEIGERLVVSLPTVKTRCLTTRATRPVWVLSTRVSRTRSLLVGSRTCSESF